VFTDSVRTTCLTQPWSMRCRSANVFHSVIVAKLLYASSAWSGFTTADDSQRVNAFLRRGKRCGFCREDLPMFEELLENRDEHLFNKIMNNTQHVMYSLLLPPSAASQHYQLRQRAHNRQHTGRLTDCNFITRMLYRDLY